MPAMPDMSALRDRIWRARDYVSASNANQKGLDVSEVNESQTLPMEDSAADEFIDMRVAGERAPMMSAKRAGAGDNGSSLEATGFGGGFGGGGGSGIGRGGIGRIKTPAITRSTSARGPGSKQPDQDEA